MMVLGSDESCGSVIENHVPSLTHKKLPNLCWLLCRRGRLALLTSFAISHWHKMCGVVERTNMPTKGWPGWVGLDGW